MSIPKVWTRAPGRHGLARLFRYCQRRAGRTGQSFLYLVPNQGLLRVRGASNPGRRGRLMTLSAFAEEVVRSDRPDWAFLDDQDRWVIVGRVVAELLEQGCLPYSAEIAREPGFIAGVAAAIAELKEAGFHPDGWQAEGPLEQEVAKIFACYQDALQTRQLLDSTDVLAAAVEAVADGRDVPVLDGALVVGTEGFFAMAPFERKLFEALAERVPEVWVEALEEPDEPLFAPIRRSLAGWRIPHRTERSRPAAGVIAHIEQNLFRKTDAQAVPSERRVCLITGPGVAGEVTVAAKEVKRLLSEEAMQPDEVALIIPDRQRYMGPLQQVMREYGIPFRATESVSAYPLGRFVLDLVLLGTGSWGKEPLLRALRAPYCAAPWLDEASVCWLEASAYNWPLMKTWDDWQAKLTPTAEAGVPAVIAGLQALADSLASLGVRQTVTDFCTAVLVALDKLGVEGQILATAQSYPHDPVNLNRVARDLNALQIVRRVLHRMSRVYALWGGEPLQLDPSEFQVLLEQELDKENHRTDPRRPGPAVEVLGPGQAYGRRFAYVFVLGLADGMLPGGPKVDFIFTEERRRALGLSTYDDRFARDRLLFLTAATRAEHRLYLCYPSPDEGEEFLPSPFVDDLKDLFTDQDTLPMLSASPSDVIPRGLAAVSSPFELRMVSSRLLARGSGQERIVADSLVTGGLMPQWQYVAHCAAVADRRDSGEYSPWEGIFEEPTALERAAAIYPADRIVPVGEVEEHALCGFRHLGERILRIGPWEPFRLGDSPKEMGGLRHAVLAGFWRRWGGRPLTMALLPEAIEIAAQVLDQTMARFAVSSLRRPGLFRWIAAVLAGEAELSEAVGGTLWPQLLEVGFGRSTRPDMDEKSVSEPLIIEVDGRRVHLSGVIDRVDAGPVEDAPVIIYDYKRSGTRDWDKAVKADLALQPMLYARAIQRLFRPQGRVTGIAYYYTDKANGTRPYVKDGLWLQDYSKAVGRQKSDSPEEMEARLQAAERVAVTAAIAMQSGDFRIAHPEKCSRYCPMRFACRRFDPDEPFVKEGTADVAQ